ncbi:asparagine synthase (glutamine-hydrolyzing) [uncultured Imperialibacter sp.]|uniref:asparagine synthase (glutamine-hydrolyzing) n=1 Tax=uncultured Imperialibacter sp. TaxID=1672639 RepID=UPI0030DB70A1|tara:strand:+ start:20432 stop:22321 length:1890 start_codon:yes stop_codon:yes gene_type:complete
MCGIAGFIEFSTDRSADTVRRMVASLHHRGPDDSGTSISRFDDAVIGLGQARLSIIDLSNGGHQPMVYQHLSIVFNGEIYNYKEIREALVQAGHKFISESDTEVILHAYDEWGRQSVTRFIGMFAFVILDSARRELVCCRDRAGVKPFYYYHNNGVFLFASELKAFHQHPLFEKEIDSQSVNLYLNYGYVPSPYSIFRHTHKLDTGHWLIFSLKDRTIQLEKYWDVFSLYKKPKASLSYDEATTELESLLQSAFEYRMVADVPVGIFLSGGYDSTAVAALLSKDRTDRLKTFTIGFDEGNNEAPFAEATATFLGTDHTSYYCNTREAQEIIPSIPFYCDEPFADSSIIPTMLVSKIAREQVTVALSADAGDEIFAGYDDYRSLSMKLQMLNSIPGFAKPPSKALMSLVKKYIPSKNIALQHKIDGLSKALNTDRQQQAIDLFRRMRSLPARYEAQLLIDTSNGYHTGYDFKAEGFTSEIEIAMAADYNMYLQNDILTKVDRATMSVSLEGREPFLDHRIVEFAASLPLGYKFDGAISKRILKEIVHKHVPFSMMDRPKAGFSLPIYQWLRKDLSYLIEEYFNEEEIRQQGIFKPLFVRTIVRQFMEGQLHYQPLIWKLLMFQMWHKKWM